MDQPPALYDAQAAACEAAVAAGDALDWESDLADLTTVPWAALDDLPPLSADSRILTEILRARSSTRGGPEPGRAE
ncbi:hypothetical protein O3Q52_18395 [Streptomyces sp. ActVer]|uniref:hypothetical protein n=1 Tax=Streptomyces sp. ActVer TaxID=3014558 RepID=UPI0022B49B32|nr:hypothetical protein [Streptomyces sp. ActVer]MCZ4510125.1 hypothetical protein [Streptomyces sp. ActVer]